MEVNNVQDATILRQIKDIAKSEAGINKDTVNSVVSKVLGKSISISNNEFKAIMDALNIVKDIPEDGGWNKSELVEDLKMIVKNNKEDFSNEDILKLDSKIKELSSDEFLGGINEILDNKGLITKMGLEKMIGNIVGKEIALNESEYNKIADTVMKMVDELENQYNEKSQKEDGQKIIKDLLTTRSGDFTSNEFNEILGKIDNLDYKEIVSIAGDNTELGGKISKEGVNDSLNKILGKEISLTDKEFDRILDFFKNPIDEHTNIEKEVFKNLENNNKEAKILKENIDMDISSKESVKKSIQTNINDIKEVAQSLLDLLNETNIKSSEVIKFIKNNMNDFKLFNSINNEYYYIDVPINNNGKEYPCKLIIKDKRKEGKKIDKTNVKMVVSVKTINLGGVDAYLTVKDSALDDNIRC